MTSTPYPSFRVYSPVDASRGVALTAVGRCRIHPTAEEIADIVSKNIQQAHADDIHVVDNDNAELTNQDAIKNAKKRLLKEGIALAKDYLALILGSLGVVSIANVEIVLPTQDVLNSNGCLASCFLDAGCETVVVREEALVALCDFPLNRICVHYDYSPVGLLTSIASIQHLCGSISIEISTHDASEKTMLSLLENILMSPAQEIIAATLPSKERAHGGHHHHHAPSKALNVSLHVHADSVTADIVASICRIASKRICDGLTTVALIDPDARQLGTAWAACLKTDRVDGLFTTVVCTRCNEALGLVYSSTESIIAALECGRGVYWSRSRAGLWRKGDTSGHTQSLHMIDVDCDGDALRFTVTQETGEDDNYAPAFCHLNTLTCWGPPRGLRLLEETLNDRLKNAPEGSYTKRLFEDDSLLRNKLVEEAMELSEADVKEHVAEELADVLYFAMVRAVKAGVRIDDAVVELDKRARRVTRRQGDAKDFRIAASSQQFRVQSNKIEIETKTNSVI